MGPRVAAEGEGWWKRNGANARVWGGEDGASRACADGAEFARIATVSFEDAVFGRSRETPSVSLLCCLRLWISSIRFSESDRASALRPTLFSHTPLSGAIHTLCFVCVFRHRSKQEEVTQRCIPPMVPVPRLPACTLASPSPCISPARGGQKTTSAVLGNNANACDAHGLLHAITLLFPFFFWGGIVLRYRCHK